MISANRKIETNNLPQISIYVLKRQGELVYYPNLIQFEYNGNYFTSGLSYQKCFFGGLRAWFRCPRCDRRAGVLYILDNSMRCRVCFNLCYHSQNLSSHLKKDFIFRALDNFSKASDLEQKIKRPIYAGETTKNQKRLEHLYYKFLKATRISDNRIIS